MDKSVYIEIRDRLKTLISGTEFENRVFFVGGCCRDDIMGFEIKDIDISVALPDGGIRLAQWLHAEGYAASEPSVFHDYHTAKFRLAEYPDIELESVQTRKESYPDRGSRNPVTSYGSQEEDCMRRDLTVNALYQNVSTGEIVDITARGLDDIRDHIIRTPADPYRTYDEDPLRILRCVRFAARFGWEIEEETFAAMKAMVPRMSILTPARISDEFLKMLQDDRPAMAVELLCSIGAVEYVLQETPSDAAIRALRTLSLETADMHLRLATLLYGSQRARDIMDRLRLSIAEVSDITCLIQCCSEVLQWETVEDSRIREMQYKCNTDDRFNDVMLLAGSISDTASKIIEIMRCSSAMIVDGTAMYGYKLPVSGKDIINELGLTPGPMIKECQEYLLKLAFRNPGLTRQEALSAIQNRILERIV